jgi:hypothetical protein
MVGNRKNETILGLIHRAHVMIRYKPRLKDFELEILRVAWRARVCMYVGHQVVRGWLTIEVTYEDGELENIKLTTRAKNYMKRTVITFVKATPHREYRLVHAMECDVSDPASCVVPKTNVLRRVRDATILNELTVSIASKAQELIKDFLKSLERVTHIPSPEVILHGGGD